jgi:hypothetical protein
MVAACEPPQRPSLRPTGTVTAKDYDHVLGDWTRRDSVYALFEHKMNVTATFITPPLRRAFQARFPEIYGYGGSVTRKELVDLSQKTEETLNFFVAIYTPEDKWNDLNKPDSIWHVTLQPVLSIDAPDETTTSRIDALAIERVKIDENLRTVYPYLTSFDQAYIVRFPAATKDTQLLVGDKEVVLRMRIASSFGAARLNWDVLP